MLDSARERAHPGHHLGALKVLVGITTRAFGCPPGSVGDRAFGDDAHALCLGLGKQAHPSALIDQVKAGLQRVEQAAFYRPLGRFVIAAVADKAGLALGLRMPGPLGLETSCAIESVTA